MKQIIIKRIYSTISVRQLNTHIPKCSDCIYFDRSTNLGLCVKFNIPAIIARIDSTKCGLFAKEFTS